MKLKKSCGNLNPLKSSGPDGISGIFFIRYWKSVKTKVVAFVQECFRLGNILANVNKAFIVLIPKVSEAANFKHFRLISLCNFLYKIVTKIITERLSTIVAKIISPYQGGFIKGR